MHHYKLYHKLLFIVFFASPKLKTNVKKRIYLQLQKWYQILVISLHRISGTDSKKQKALK